MTVISFTNYDRINNFMTVSAYISIPSAQVGLNDNTAGRLDSLTPEHLQERQVGTDGGGRGRVLGHVLHLLERWWLLKVEGEAGSRGAAPSGATLVVEGGGRCRGKGCCPFRDDSGC